MSANDSSQQVVDSPTGWVADHIKEYVESDGEKGHEWRDGVPTLLLSVKGRKSGLWRRTALIYGRDGDNYVVVASKGGSETHPLWYLNLSDNPDAEIQVGADKLRVRARDAEGEERARLWQTMSAIWPDYNNYQTKTDRQIPVIVLEPAS
ncbi:nitroreductase family deazaflavin-dependent oxidoreductase [Actinocrinis sp.]|uniref:nitroreductase family deazaflavin-dependent oxidoreductase n=1 Tax=Actinocrinis sp. TaxID=1920516 RepID=UPI002CB4984B|nr:nitroreductase family deazaflavin-dependent oxidoreductase [Actinocrinis sp.]HXR69152.1 nitroreductase family deazaflavin-dependent oxidoreductase [Actinocrinis sp.]